MENEINESKTQEQSGGDLVKEPKEELIGAMGVTEESKKAGKGWVVAVVVIVILIILGIIIF